METNKLHQQVTAINYPEARKPSASVRVLLIGKAGETGITVLQTQDVIIVRNFNEAAYYLDQAAKEKSDLPDVIALISDQNSLKKTTDFGRFLNRDKRLRAIPFVAFEKTERDLNATQINRKQIKGIDDIIPDAISADKFLTKIALLKKFKLLKQFQNSSHPNPSQEIPPARRVLYSWDAFFKRLLDIMISAPALVILSPLILIIAIIIKIDSKGPVFYLSYRAGSNYRIFKFIKFRTMVVEADHKLSRLMDLNQYASSNKNDPVFFKISNDPRVTKVGKFLRNTSLDEIPQLLNVLKGDMSLVGNRPLPLYEAKTLTTDSHAERFNAPAGITGLWQISKRGQKEMSVEERIALDINYARNNSFIHDFQIMLKTPKALIQKDNV